MNVVYCSRDWRFKGKLDWHIEILLASFLVKTSMLAYSTLNQRSFNV